MAKREKDSYGTGAHTTHRLMYHLVSCKFARGIPKYRRRVLEGAVAARLKELFDQACEVNPFAGDGDRNVNDWQMHELSIMPDHVHLLLQIHPRESVAEAVQALKGGSSVKLRKEFVEFAEFLWGDSFWCDGYFAESVGQTQEGVIPRHIKNQRDTPAAAKRRRKRREKRNGNGGVRKVVGDIKKPRPLGRGFVLPHVPIIVLTCESSLLVALRFAQCYLLYCIITYAKTSISHLPPYLPHRAGLGAGHG